MERTAVVLDEHPLWLDAVEAVLARLQVKVEGKTTSVARTLELIDSHRPDVLLLEPADNSGDGRRLDLMRRAREIHPSLKVIVLSNAHEASAVDAAFAAGAVAYVFKSAHPDDLASAIRQAFDVSVFFAHSQAVSANVTSIRQQAAQDQPGLTKRELEILQLVAEGHSNGELARMLWVTEQTVKFHLSNIYRKLDVANRTEASRWAQLHGLLAEPMAATA
ncbi:MAG: response regulator transcription factor [Thermoleophilia bacterium]|nr:response regulator transcription factor [Thermoleophilia bacterium]